MSSRHESLSIVQGKQVRKRDGRIVPFDETKINWAVEMAFRAEFGCPYPDTLPSPRREQIQHVTDAVVNQLEEKIAGANVIDIETIQDEVERRLMASEEYA